MRARVVLALGVLLVMGCAHLSAQTQLWDHEPSYKNRSLGAWLRDLQGDPANRPFAEAQEALKEIGAGALPLLLTEMRASAPPSANPFDPRRDRGLEMRFNAALCGLRALGAEAAPAVPELVRMIHDGIFPEPIVVILRDLGPAGCTKESVDALAQLALSPNPNGALAFCSVETLRQWGPRASNAVPQLLTGLKAQIAAGGPNRRAELPPSPMFDSALAQIAPNSPEVMAALLEVKPVFGFTSLEGWRDNSAAGTALLCGAVTNATLPVSARKRALNSLALKADTNLLGATGRLLEEKELRASVLSYLQRLGTNSEAAFPAVIEFVQKYGDEDRHFAELALLQTIGRRRSANAASLIRQLLPLSFDDRFPINSGIPIEEGFPIWVMARCAIEDLAGGADRTQLFLFEALRDPDWKVRNAAVARLWGTGPWAPTEVAALAALLYDTNETVRLSSAVTLGRTPGYQSQILENLLEAASSRSLSAALRVHALRFLQQLGPWPEKSTEVLEAVTAARQDADPLVQKQAARVLDDLSRRNAALPDSSPEPRR